MVPSDRGEKDHLSFRRLRFRVEAIVAKLFGRVPLHCDVFSRDIFSLGQLSGIEQCVLGTRLDGEAFLERAWTN